MDGCVWMADWMEGWMVGYIYRSTDAQTVGWVDGKMGGWGADGWGE